MTRHRPEYSLESAFVSRLFENQVVRMGGDRNDEVKAPYSVPCMDAAI